MTTLILIVEITPTFGVWHQLLCILKTVIDVAEPWQL